MPYKTDPVLVNTKALKNDIYKVNNCYEKVDSSTLQDLVYEPQADIQESQADIQESLSTTNTNLKITIQNEPNAKTNQTNAEKNTIE